MPPQVWSGYPPSALGLPEATKMLMPHKTRPKKAMATAIKMSTWGTWKKMAETLRTITNRPNKNKT